MTYVHVLSVACLGGGVGGALAWEGHGGLLRCTDIWWHCALCVGMRSGGQVSIRPGTGSVWGGLQLESYGVWSFPPEHQASEEKKL